MLIFFWVSEFNEAIPLAFSCLQPFLLQACFASTLSFPTHSSPCAILLFLFGSLNSDPFRGNNHSEFFPLCTIRPTKVKRRCFPLSSSWLDHFGHLFLFVCLFLAMCHAHSPSSYFSTPHNQIVLHRCNRFSFTFSSIFSPGVCVCVWKINSFLSLSTHGAMHCALLWIILCLYFQNQGDFNLCL